MQGRGRAAEALCGDAAAARARLTELDAEGVGRWHQTKAAGRQPRAKCQLAPGGGWGTYSLTNARTCTNSGAAHRAA